MRQIINELPLFLNGFAVSYIFFSVDDKNLIFRCIMYFLALITLLWYAKVQKNKES